MTKCDRITVYRADDGWRWNYRAKNGRILADGSEAYRRRIDCLHGMERVTGGLPTPTPDRCPECQRGRVVQVSSDPRAVQYVCSRRCGWDA
jgi:uncharacterized protein YegP (UPF0339 family)